MEILTVVALCVIYLILGIGFVLILGGIWGEPEEEDTFLVGLIVLVWPVVLVAALAMGFVLGIGWIIRWVFRRWL